MAKTNTPTQQRRQMGSDGVHAASAAIGANDCTSDTAQAPTPAAVAAVVVIITTKTTTAAATTAAH